MAQSAMLDERGRLALDNIRAGKLVAILRGPDSRYVAAAARTLIDAGIGVIEVALTTPGALGAIQELASVAPAEVSIGAGTVLTARAAAEAVSAGASYFVTPAVVPEVISAAGQFQVPVLAGALTPTEILAAHRAGAQLVKVFPAALGGPAYLKWVRDPLPEVPLVPTGGVNLADVSAYLAVGATAVGLGGQLVGDALRGGDLDQLADRARQAVAAAASAGPRP